MSGRFKSYFGLHPLFRGQCLLVLYLTILDHAIGPGVIFHDKVQRVISAMKDVTPWLSILRILTSIKSVSTFPFQIIYYPIQSHTTRRERESERYQRKTNDKNTKPQ